MFHRSVVGTIFAYRRICIDTCGTTLNNGNTRGFICGVFRIIAPDVGYSYVADVRSIDGQDAWYVLFFFRHSLHGKAKVQHVPACVQYRCSGLNA